MGMEVTPYHTILRKKLIFKNRSRLYPRKTGEASPAYIKLPPATESYIVKTWKSLQIPHLKELTDKTKISQHLCKRTLLKYKFTIPNKHETQKRLLKAGIIKPSRYVEFNPIQLKKIIFLYKKCYVGAREIAKKFGYKSEGVILKVLRKNNIRIYSKSEMTRYNNLKRSYNGSYKK